MWRLKHQKYWTMFYKFIQLGKSPFWRSFSRIHLQKRKSFVLAFLSSTVPVKCRCIAVPPKHTLYPKTGIVKSITSLQPLPFTDYGQKCHLWILITQSDVTILLHTSWMHIYLFVGYCYSNKSFKIKNERIWTPLISHDVVRKCGSH